MITFKFQWKLDNVNILNETNPFYTVKAGDVGKNISCEVTATNSYGNTIVETMAVTPVAKPNNTVVPVITGNVTVIGSTLASSNGTWTGYPTPTYTYQWRRNGANVAGKTANTYVTTNTDIDANVSVIVTANNSAGGNVAYSANVMVRSAPLRSVNNVISGANTIGSTLTSTQGTWLGSPSIGYTYQWRRNTANIVGSTGTTYTLQSADLDANVTCVVTATSTYGSNTSTSNIIVGSQAPINTVSPTISGTPTVGQNLTVNNGTWTGSATITYTYQWKRNGVNISAATGSTYTVTTSDLGTPITCTVTATNSRGSASATSSNSLVGQQAPQRSANNTITSGSTPTLVGQAITTNNGTWTGYPAITYTYQWKRDNVNITNETSSGYLPQTADIDASITCEVTATNALGSNTSISNAIVVRSPPVNTGLPTISGTPSVGSTLTASQGTWTGSTALAYTYQWKRGGSNIVGATSSTYVVVTADIDASITCTVTATNPYGSASATTAGTTAWQAPVNTVAPVVSGSSIVGSLLTSTSGTWTGSATITFAYQWKRDDVNISSATSSTYTTTPTDIGTIVTCEVTATNGRGSASSTSNGLTISSSITVADQAFDFGALTKAGAGGVRMVSSGGEISSASIVAGNALGHWNISPDGTITPNTAGDTADLNAGPYQIQFSFNAGVAIANATISIIGNSYSVASNSEVEAVIGTTTNGDLGTPASLAAARTILFRTGNYVGFHDDMLKTKSWGNVLTLKPHAGAIPLIKKQLSVYAGANVVFDGLTFVVEDVNNKAGISFANAYSAMTVQNCMFYANTLLSKTGTSYGDAGPYITYGLHYANGSVGTGMSVVNNSFHDLYHGVHGQSDGTHSIQGNFFYDIYSTPIRIIQSSSSTSTVISDNVIEGTIAKVSDSGSPSSVFVALDGNNSISADWSGIKVYRNIAINKYSFATPAGIRADNMNSSYYHNAVEVFGNVLINGENANTGLEIKRAKACVVRGNTIVSPNFASGSSAPGILVGGTASSGTHVIENNAYDSITSYGTTTLTNNVLLGAKGATVSYASAFVGPTFTVANRADVLSKFAMKTSGPLDLATNVGAVGSGYVSWASSSPGNNGGFLTSIPDQTFDFGAKTRGGHGAVTVASGSVTISTATITGGTGSGWFDISNSGVITKKAANNTTLPAGPLTLNLSINGGLYNPTITINTSGNDARGFNLSLAYSVSTDAEITTVGELSTIAYGEIMMIRPGTYNASQDMSWGIWRSTKPTGSFTTPTYKSVPAGQPTGSLGYDVSTANWFTITKHAGATPVIKRIRINNNSGNDNNTNIYGIRINGLEFYRTNTPGVSIVNGSGTTVNQSTSALNESTSTLSFTNGATWTCVDNCIIHGTAGAGLASLIDTHSGIYGGKENFLIYDNEFYDVLYGVGNMNASPHGFHAIGNKFYRVWFDCLSVRPADNIKMNFNMFWDKKSPYKMVGGGIHPDLMQINNETTFVPSLLNGQVIGNMGWRGVGSTTVDGGAYDATDFQGLILASSTYSGTTAIATNWYIQGNIFINTGEYNKMIMSIKDSFVRWNTAATHKAPTNEFTGTIADGWIRLNPESTNNVVQFNVCESIVLDSPADTAQQTVANNTFVNRTVANNIANSYALNFTGAHTIQNTAVVYPDLITTYYSINTSSVAYTSNPRHGAAGTGYIDYSTRATSFPDATQQNVDFGELTRGGNGAVVISSPLTVTSASITDGTGNYSLLETTVSDGVAYLRKKTSNNNSLGTTPFTCTVSLNGGAAIKVMTINCIANAYSVNAIAELKSTIELGTLALGQTIYLRSGDYNKTYVDYRCWRGSPPTGVFNGNNHVVITRHTGDTPRIWKVGWKADGTTNWPFKWYDLDFVAEPNTSFSGAAAGMFYQTSGVWYTWFDSCRFVCNTAGANSITRGWTPVGVYMFAGNCAYNSITNCYFKGLQYAGTITGNNTTIEGNISEEIIADDWQFGQYLNNLRFRFNILRNKRYVYSDHQIQSVTFGTTTSVYLNPSDAAQIATSYDAMWFVDLNGASGLVNKYSAVGQYTVNTSTGEVKLNNVDSTGSTPFVSGTLRKTAAHSDNVQINAAQEPISNAVFEGNILQVNDGGQPDMGSAQGFFMAYKYDGLIFRGNIYYGSSPWGLAVNGQYFRNSQVMWNTLVHTNDTIGFYTSDVAFNMTGNSTTWDIKNNIIKYNVWNSATAISGAGVSNNQYSNNYEIPVGTIGTIYPQIFANAKNSNVAMDASVDLALVPGSALDLPVKLGAAGTGYIDYVNRTVSFPVEFSTNVDTTRITSDTTSYRTDKV